MSTPRLAIVSLLTLSPLFLVGCSAGQIIELGIFEGLEQAKRIDVRLKITPPAERLQDAFAILAAVCRGLLRGRLG